MNATGRGGRREELKALYEQRVTEPVVYVLRHIPSGKILLASTPDLASLRNRLGFGRTTGSPGVFDRRLLEDARRDGVTAFELEVLDRLEVRPEMTADEVEADLRALEGLWREKLAGTAQY